MKELYRKAKWMGARWILVLNTAVVCLLVYSSFAEVELNKPALQGNDGPQEAAAYYLAGGHAGLFDPESSELVQMNKAFSPDVVSVPTGSTIAFPNRDSFTHNVYSPEGVDGFFDLGFARTTDTDNVNLITKAFNTEGVIKVSCAIHPVMKAHIFVVPSKYHTASKDGSYTFSNVPAGTYDLMVVTGSGTPEKLKSVTL